MNHCSARHRTGAHRPRGRLFRPAQAVPQRRLLLRDHSEGHGVPDQHVYGSICRGSHGGLGRPMEGDDQGSRAEDQPATPALHRTYEARIHTARRAGLSRHDPGHQSEPSAKIPTNVLNLHGMLRLCFLFRSHVDSAAGDRPPHIKKAWVSLMRSHKSAVMFAHDCRVGGAEPGS